MPINNKYLENYNSKDYKNYLVQLKNYKEYKKIIKNLKRNNPNNYYKETENKYILKYGNINIDITRPEYENIFDKIEEYKIIKKELKIDYDYHQYNILHNINDEKDFEKYNNIVIKLKDLDKNITDLIEYYINVNKKINTDKENNNEIIEKRKKRKAELYEKIGTDGDDVRVEQYINEYLELYNCNIENLENSYNKIDYIIVKKPKINELSEEDLSKEDLSKDKSKKSKNKCSKTVDDIIIESEKKLKEKIKRKLNKTSKEKLDNLEKSVKDKLFKEFKFKNELECESKSSSKDFYMKKSEILKIIKKYKKAKDILPKDLEKLSKNSLCKELFKLK